MVILSPGWCFVITDDSAEASVTFLPSTETITSPAARPALAAPESGITAAIAAPSAWLIEDSWTPMNAG